MKTTSEKLISDLMERTTKNINEALKFKELSAEDLNRRPGEGSWSILECLEHLNLYGDFYLPEIERSLNGNNTKPTKHFTSGLLGNYFANSMLPRENLNKMKTFKNKNPLGSQLDRKTIDRFLLQQKRLIELLNRARKINLEKTKTGISISRLLKLKLGDTFRVVIYHNERHIVQAQKVLESSEFRIKSS